MYHADVDVWSHKDVCVGSSDHIITFLRWDGSSPEPKLFMHVEAV